MARRRPSRPTGVEEAHLPGVERHPHGGQSLPGRRRRARRGWRPRRRIRHRGRRGGPRPPRSTRAAPPPRRPGLRTRRPTWRWPRRRCAAHRPPRPPACGPRRRPSRRERRRRPRRSPSSGGAGACRPRAPGEPSNRASRTSMMVAASRAATGPGACSVGSSAAGHASQATRRRRASGSRRGDFERAVGRLAAPRSGRGVGARTRPTTAGLLHNGDDAGQRHRR